MGPTVLVVESRGAQRRICLGPGPAATPVGEGRMVVTDGAQKVGLGICPRNTPRRPQPLIPAKRANLAMGSAVTAVGSSLGPTMAYLRPGPVAMAAGEGGDAAAAGMHENCVRRCLVTPPRQRQLVTPAKKASLATGPTVTWLGSSLGPSTASLRPDPVAMGAGEGRDAAAAEAQENWVRRCLVTPPQQRRPVIPAKQASLAMGPIVKTGRSSPGPSTASLRPGLVADGAQLFGIVWGGWRVEVLLKTVVQSNWAKSAMGKRM